MSQHTESKHEIIANGDATAILTTGGKTKPITVIGTDPVRESSTTTTPQQVCEDVTVQERLPERDGNVGGTVAGALIGGLVGNQVGGGNGRKAATAAGAVAGGGFISPSAGRSAMRL